MDSLIASIDQVLNSLGASHWALPAVAIIAGLINVAGGWWALQSPQNAQQFMRELPRNQTLGRVLIGVDLVWSLYLYYESRLELGGYLEFFSPHEPGIYLLSPFIYFFIVKYVDNYLGARSVALFLLLVAKPVLVI